MSHQSLHGIRLPAGGDVRIALDQREGRPSTQLLDRPEIDPVFHQACGKRMSRHMRRYANEPRTLTGRTKPSDRMIRFSVGLGKDKVTGSREPIQRGQDHRVQQHGATRPTLGIGRGHGQGPARDIHVGPPERQRLALEPEPAVRADKDRRSQRLGTRGEKSVLFLRFEKAKALKVTVAELVE